MRLKTWKLETGSRQDKTVLSCLQLCSHRQHGQDKTRQDKEQATSDTHGGERQAGGGAVWKDVVQMISTGINSAQYHSNGDLTAVSVWSAETHTQTDHVAGL